MIESSESFLYDGISSKDLGIINVSVDNGLQEEPFHAATEIIETTIRGREKPYFQEIRREPLEFELRLYFENGFDKNKKRKIGRWLKQSYYKPLIFSEDKEKIYYCMAVDEITLVHNNIDQGYLEVTMRCDSPYAYSHVSTSPVYDSVDNSTIEVTNKGDESCLPIIILQKKNIDGDVSILNMTNGGEEMVFTDMVTEETLTIDCENEYIETDVPEVYRYDNHNGVYLELLRGINRLKITGDCKIQFQFQYKILG